MRVVSGPVTEPGDAANQREHVAAEVQPPLQVIVDAPPLALLRARERISTSDARECFSVPASGGEQAPPGETVDLDGSRGRRWRLDATSSTRFWDNCGPMPN
jgi:hypothetical protein